MGLFDKIGSLFEKKTCDVCGGEIGLLGNRKLEDGNLCKECAAKLSPLFGDRRGSTVEQIKEQLAYRAENEARVAALSPTRMIGKGTRLVIDDNARCFVVVSSSGWRNNNPDVIDFSQVIGCNTEVRETKTEIKREKEDGTKESFNPPRFDYDYDMYVTIDVNSPYFDRICFKVNGKRIDRRGSTEFFDNERLMFDIRDALEDMRNGVSHERDAQAAAYDDEAAW